MDKNKVWNEFLETMIQAHFEDYKHTDEYKYLHQRRMYLDELITNGLNSSQRELFEEVAFEFGSMDEANADRMYAQGMRDCVMILKNLGVLA